MEPIKSNSIPVEMYNQDFSESLYKERYQISANDRSMFYSCSSLFKVSKYVVYDIVRNKVLLAYTAFLLLISLSLFNLEDETSKALVSLSSVIMIIVPLISIVFSTTYFYNSYEFTELLVSQPLRRSSILLGESCGIALSLLLAFVVGVALPVMVYDGGAVAMVMVMSGLGLTLAFVSLSFLASVMASDKAKGIGISLLLWFYFAVIYDALVLGIMFAFSDYPMERAMIGFASLNPIDLGRIVILLKLDVSALMGYTGALYRDFFGSGFGIGYAFFIMIIWVLLPLYVAVRIFNRKNL